MLEFILGASLTLNIATLYYAYLGDQQIAAAQEIITKLMTENNEDAEEDEYDDTED